jgi:hypothetical protein
MSTSHTFNGRIETIPGSRSVIKSGIKNPIINLPYGHLVIIDTGSGAGWGGGSGIDGSISKGKESIYEFDNITDFQEFVRGGKWWLLAEPLFRPAQAGIAGVSKISYVKAATTTAAESTIEFTGDGNGSQSTVNGGSFTIQVTDEGLIGNGSLNTTTGLLKKGYGWQMAAGTTDTTKFVIKFYVGSYKGDDQNGLSFNNISANDSTPELIATSPEFNDAQTLLDWMLRDFTFNKFFKLKTYSLDGDRSVDSYDLINNASLSLFSGGTESYASPTLLTSVLEQLVNVNMQFIFADKFGISGAIHANNIKIANWIKESSKFQPELYVAAGSTQSEFAASRAITPTFDNDCVSIVHGGASIITQQGTKVYNSEYVAAAILGREAGLAPQIPLTFKNIKIDALTHQLSEKEQKLALSAGLLVVINDGTFDILKGINSLQKNTYLQNEDVSTHSKKLKRIARQLNAEIMILSRQDLLKNPVGTNRSTLSPEVVDAWLEGYLKTKKATEDNDNLILSFREIEITRNQDAYFIKYKFVGNTEISFLFFTGISVDV